MNSIILLILVIIIFKIGLTVSTSPKQKKKRNNYPKMFCASLIDILKKIKCSENNAVYKYTSLLTALSLFIVSLLFEYYSHINLCIIILLYIISACFFGFFTYLSFNNSKNAENTLYYLIGILVAVALFFIGIICTVSMLKTSNEIEIKILTLIICFLLGSFLLIRASINIYETIIEDSGEERIRNPKIFSAFVSSVSSVTPLLSILITIFDHVPVRLFK